MPWRGGADSCWMGTNAPPSTACSPDAGRLAKAFTITESSVSGSLLMCRTTVTNEDSRTWSNGARTTQGILLGHVIAPPERGASQHSTGHTMFPKKRPRHSAAQTTTPGRPPKRWRVTGRWPTAARESLRWQFRLPLTLILLSAIEAIIDGRIEGFAKRQHVSDRDYQGWRLVGPVIHHG